MKNWTYKRVNKIENFKDLALERQKLELHQDFLKELLSKDKELMIEAASPGNIISSVISGVSSSNSSGTADLLGLMENSSKGTMLSILIKVAKFVFNKIIKD